jgi:acyl-phosphate glycerol 3-phosphate acyltransferase
MRMFTERRPYSTRVIDTLAMVASYLLASVSFPYWIARAKGIDLRAFGSRKLGGSNLAKAVTPLHGIAGGLLDAAKGFAAVVLTRAVGLPLETQLLCGLAAIAGQMWPIFHQFDGGRANATTWGFQLATDFIAFFIAWIPVIVAAALRVTVRPRPKRLLPIANLLSYAVFPAVIWEQEGVTPTVLAGVAAMALVLIRRLTAGLADDLATGAPASRVIVNRALFDRSELQERGLVAIT